MTPNVTPVAPPVLVYDGECGFCSRWVQFVLRRDPLGSLRFAPRDGMAGRAVRERHPELIDVESMLWVETVEGRERVRTKSAGALAVLVYLGGMWGALGRVGLAVPRIVRDPVYAVIARVRRRIFDRVDPSCMVVPPAERARFLG